MPDENYTKYEIEARVNSYVPVVTGTNDMMLILLFDAKVKYFKTKYRCKAEQCLL